MPLAVTEAELQKLLAETTFTRKYGFTLHSFADGECTLRVPFQEEFERPGGIVGGQVFMTAADVALWLAIKTRLGIEDGSVTAEMKTNFLGAARREEFLCRAKILKMGKRLIFGTAECSSDARIFAYHTLTYIRP